MKALIVSGKFNIALISPINAYNALLSDLNYDTELVLDRKYTSYINEIDCAEITYTDNIKNYTQSVDCMVFVNLSLKDIYIIKNLKKINPLIKVFLIYHEPWRGFAEEWKRRCKFIFFFKTYLRHIYSKFSLKRVDVVFLGGKTAIDEYKKHDIRLNHNYVEFPLIFKDEINREIEVDEKKFFSYIATVSEGKNFSSYIKYIKKAYKEMSDQRFLIATKDDISYIMHDSTISEMVENKKLIIYQGHALSNREINDAYYKSCAVWLAYRYSTQSGVLCKALMAGTPCIATNVGIFEKYISDLNGAIIHNVDSYDEISYALEKIKNNLNDYTKAARNTYLCCFDYKKHTDRFLNILNSNLNQ